MGFHIIGMCKICEDCALRKVKKTRISKISLACSKVQGERLFFDISSPSTPTFDGKKHGLLVVGDSTDFI